MPATTRSVSPRLKAVCERLIVLVAVAAALAASGCTEARSRSAEGAGQQSARADPPAGRATTAGGPTRLVVEDRAGDVTHTFNEGDDHPKRVSYPGFDLRRVVVTHDRPSVKVVEQIADLQPSGFQQFGVGLRVPRRTFFGHGVLGRVRHGRAPVLVEWELQNRGNGFELRCPAASGRASFVRNLVVVVVPTTCLGNPPWVRVDVWNTLDRADDQQYTDDLDAVADVHGYTARVFRP
jgi:hypothetical protein